MPAHVLIQTNKAAFTPTINRRFRNAETKVPNFLYYIIIYVLNVAMPTRRDLKLLNLSRDITDSEIYLLFCVQ